ncbi:GNAT family N-acetyltransferase [Nonomuraea sp. NPDC048826]|uniref:GNAT family N-acetyltransferase n=1 Tax=Nonomuraea sp. NPDC048826 TaxID=3364347 RepID=UPI00371DF529
MWTFTRDVEAYAKAAEPFLMADPVRNTVALTALAGIRAGLPADGALYGWWTDGGQVRGAVFRTPPHPCVLARMPVEAIAPLVAALGGDVPEFVGPVEVTREVQHALGSPGRVLPERLYRLGTLTVPQAPGRGRPATGDDVPLLAGWTRAFFDEVALEGGDIMSRVTRRVAAGELFLWEDGGEPVSMAGLSVAVGGVCRVAPVYTPPARRRRGYGAAVTAHVCTVGLAERCDQIVLFTDLANPTSNAVYQSIGFEPVADYAQVTIRP